MKELFTTLFLFTCCFFSPSHHNDDTTTLHHNNNTNTIVQSSSAAVVPPYCKVSYGLFGTIGFVCHKHILDFPKVNLTLDLLLCRKQPALKYHMYGFDRELKHHDVHITDFHKQPITVDVNVDTWGTFIIKVKPLSNTTDHIYLAFQPFVWPREVLYDGEVTFPCNVPLFWLNTRSTFQLIMLGIAIVLFFMISSCCCYKCFERKSDWPLFAPNGRCTDTKFKAATDRKAKAKGKSKSKSNVATSASLLAQQFWRRMQQKMNVES